MFRIGEFSRIARVSCRLLRYYDEIGLLKPASIERDSGYRYYSAVQLSRLNRILVLKDLGLTLEEIARVINDELPAAELRGMLLMRRTQVEQALDAESQRLRQIEARIEQIDMEGQLSADDVIVRSEPVRRILSTRRMISSFAEARELIRHLSEIVRGRVARQALGSVIVIPHSDEFEPDCVDLEVGYILEDELCAAPAPMAGVTFDIRELPPVERMATCVHVGSPEQGHRDTEKIGRFVEANGYRLAGPSREVFLQPPRLGRLQDNVVEMQFPIEKRAATPSER